jgi:hypothetical protein
MSWTQAPGVVKVIYLVGDAPPPLRRQLRHDALGPGRRASSYTIQCGTDPAGGSWRRIATPGGGQFMAIHQDGGMHEEHSRYDDELAALHDKLAGTAIAYGAGRASASAALKDAEAAPIAVKAARAAFMARNGKAIAGKGDLVESVASGAVKLEEVQAELPPEMKAMDKAKQAAVVAEKSKQRNEINKRIDELGRLRRSELDAREAAAHKAGIADGFDVAAKKALKKSVDDNALSGLSL